MEEKAVNNIMQILTQDGLTVEQSKSILDRVQLIFMESSQNFLNACDAKEVLGTPSRYDVALPECENYFVVPDNYSQTITIMPDIDGAVLKLNKANALRLASIIQDNFSKEYEETLIEYIAGINEPCTKEDEIQRAETIGRMFAVLKKPEDAYALRFALSNLITSIHTNTSFQIVVNYDKDLKKVKINYSNNSERFLK